MLVLSARESDQKRSALVRNINARETENNSRKTNHCLTSILRAKDNVLSCKNRNRLASNFHMRMFRARNAWEEPTPNGFEFSNTELGKRKQTSNSKQESNNQITIYCPGDAKEIIIDFLKQPSTSSRQSRSNWLVIWSFKTVFNQEIKLSTTYREDLVQHGHIKVVDQRNHQENGFSKWLSIARFVTGFL